MTYNVTKEQLIEVGANLSPDQMQTILASYFLKCQVDFMKDCLKESTDDEEMAAYISTLTNAKELGEETLAYIDDSMDLGGWIREHALKLAKHFIIPGASK